MCVVNPNTSSADAKNPSNVENNLAHSIQAVSLENHVFQLNLNEVKQILEHENIKDRYVVSVSIAGPFRMGKSFLLNFFLKYLYAQYERHNVADWLNAKEDESKLSEFKWRGGSTPETKGIWMWSHIFTHDFENGVKLAIILFDTQGIFDNQTTIKEATTIFALSMMLSSVQCYNIKNQIQEDHLQNLQLFSKYGKLLQEKSNEKPFQKLIFLVRDWSCPDEYGFGWDGKKINEILDENLVDTDELHQLRIEIKSTFNVVDAFLLPAPGKIVERGKFTGDIQEIDLEFIQYLEDLVAGIFSPEKLIIKTINNRKVKAHDLVQYMDTYLKTFTQDKLPEPKTLLMATIEVSYKLLAIDCVNLYYEKMQEIIDNYDDFLSDGSLNLNHTQTKATAIKKFSDEQKLDDSNAAAFYQSKIENDVQKYFLSFKQRNDAKIQKYRDQYGKWAEFERLDKLDFKYVDSNQTSSIYANGKNQIEIIIILKICGDDGPLLDLEPDELRDIFYLCHEETGERLNESFILSDQPNEFTRSLINSDGNDVNAKSNDQCYIHKYISCSQSVESENVIRFSVGINIPGIGEFNTSACGTKTPNERKGDGGLSRRLFQSQKSLELVIKPRIDYGHPGNVIIDKRPFVEISDSLKWTKRFWHISYTDKSDGRCQRSTVYITPNTAATGQTKFKDYKIFHEHPMESDINKKEENDQKKPVWMRADVKQTEEHGNPMKCSSNGQVSISKFEKLCASSFKDVKTGFMKKFGDKLGYLSERNFNWFEGKEKYFDIFREGGSDPLAVISLDYKPASNPTAQTNEYQLNIWFPGKSNINIDGHIHIASTHSLYRFSPLAIEDHTNDDDHGLVTLLLYKFILPDTNLYRYGWRNFVRPVTIAVIDFHGNEGSFVLTFNDSEYFDTPGLL